MIIELYKLIEDLHAATILIVSHSKSNASMIKTLLKRHNYEDVQITTDPFNVVDIYKKEKLDLIILEINMQGLDGFGVMQAIREASEKSDSPENIPPILVMTAVNDQKQRRRALNEGANDYVNFPFDKGELIARIHNLLEIWQAQKIIQHQNEILDYKVRQRTKELYVVQDDLHESRLEVAWVLGRAVEYRDNETGLHIIRMSKIAALLGKASGLSDEKADLILNASPMHDIGKLGIPDSILLKPGKLNAEEWETMQTHAQIGADILSGSNSPLLKAARDIALSHHEKWDGTGYPNKLKGDEIPVAVRLSTIADVFDALTSVRPYKQAWSVEETIEYFHAESGKQFDPALVKLLAQELTGVLKIKEEFADPVV